MPRTRPTKILRYPLVTTVAVAALCFGPTPGFTTEAGPDHGLLPGSDSHRIVHSGRVRALHADGVHPGTPMMLDPDFGGFPFNFGDSDDRRLRLQLNHPLVLEAGSQQRWNGEASVLGLDATLRIPVGGGLSFAGRVDHRALVAEPFRSVGSIHCNNGILRPDSYTASGCRFVNDGAVQFDRRTLSMGPQFDLGNISGSLRWFTSEADHRFGTATTAVSPWRSMPLMDPLLTPGAGVGPGGPAFGTLAGETSGIDLDFQVGFATDQAGEIRLGLALTRIYGASYDGMSGGTASPLQWSVAAPFDTASMGIEWNRGAFSGGLRGYYREPISLLDRTELEGMGTFDVHFTWRTPWNANLSVGASNVLSAGADNSAASDKPADRFESIYGRIPYVRYQQDL